MRDHFPEQLSEARVYEGVTNVGNGTLRVYHHRDDGDHVRVQWYDTEDQKWVDFTARDLENTIGLLLFLYHEEPWTATDIERMAQACEYYTRQVEGPLGRYDLPTILGPRLLEKFVEYNPQFNVPCCDYYQMRANIDKYLADLERTDYLTNGLKDGAD